jgi:hypothetical protein
VFTAVRSSNENTTAASKRIGATTQTHPNRAHALTVEHLQLLVSYRPVGVWDQDLVPTSDQKQLTTLMLRQTLGEQCPIRLDVYDRHDVNVRVVQNGRANVR